MQIRLVIVGALVVVIIVLLFPPAVHISRDTYTRTIFASMSDTRATIFVIAIASFIAAVVSAAVSAVRHTRRRI